MKLESTQSVDLSPDLTVKIDDVGNLYIHKRGRNETRDAKAVLKLNYLETIALANYFKGMSNE